MARRGRAGGNRPHLRGERAAKALYYAAATGELTVAEDSGLAIDALDGAPGVESARFGGVELPYPEKFALIDAALRAKGDRESTGAVRLRARAGARTVACCSKRAARSKAASRRSREGSGGFGYDPIFFYPPYGQTLAEAGDAKAAVSHRGEAFRALRAFLAVPFLNARASQRAGRARVARAAKTLGKSQTAVASGLPSIARHRHQPSAMPSHLMTLLQDLRYALRTALARSAPSR